MSNIFLKEEYLGSGKYLKHAISKYGIENFKVELVEWCETFELINEREKYWIKYFESRNPKIGYNIAEGGEGGDTWRFLAKEDKERAILERKKHIPSQKGWKVINNGSQIKKVPVDKLSKYLAEGWILGSLNKGKRLSKEHKKIISEKHKGRIYINKNGVEKQIYEKDVPVYLNDGWKKGRDEKIGKIISKFTKGRVVSDEGRKNMSAAHLNNACNQKTQKGYKTINNGIKEKHIPSEMLSQYLDEGWQLGRLPVSEEHRKHLSAANKGQIPWCKGFKYMNNNITEKRVAPADIEKYLELGWHLGRLSK